MSNILSSFRGTSEQTASAIFDVGEIFEPAIIYMGKLILTGINTFEQNILKLKFCWIYDTTCTSTVLETGHSKYDLYGIL